MAGTNISGPILSAMSSFASLANRQQMIKTQKQQAETDKILAEQAAARDKADENYRKSMLTATQLQAESMSQLAGKYTGRTQQSQTQPLPNEQPELAKPQLSAADQKVVSDIQTSITENQNKPLDLSNPNALYDFILTMGDQYGGTIQSMPNSIKKLYMISKVERGLWSMSYTNINNEQAKRENPNDVAHQSMNFYSIPPQSEKRRQKNSDIDKVGSLNYYGGKGQTELKLNDNYGKGTPDANRMNEKRKKEWQEKAEQAAKRNRLEPKPPKGGN